ncbi:ATP synthase F1 subunit gamma [bacterium]|nr:ATP synthase F1 subunit gamma [bacterium]
MANLKELRVRIASVQSTMQITSAMKMVSAAKLKRAQDAIQQMRPYAEKLREILSNISASLEGTEGRYSTERPVRRVLLVAITSNRGLCGAFNANVLKMARRQAEEYRQRGVEVDILAIGRKGADFFKKSGTVVGNHSELFDGLGFDKVAEVAAEIMQWYVEERYDKVMLCYNRFKNAGVQELTNEEFLPVKVESIPGVQNNEYLFEPSRTEILEDLIPTALKTQLFKSLLDSVAAEHGARMTAMHKATDNANELQKGLKLDYNKARQAAITNEILEIVGGAEALNG